MMKHWLCALLKMHILNMRFLLQASRKLKTDNTF